MACQPLTISSGSSKAAFLLGSVCISDPLLVARVNLALAEGFLRVVQCYLGAGGLFLGHRSLQLLVCDLLAVQAQRLGCQQHTSKTSASD